MPLFPNPLGLLIATKVKHFSIVIFQITAENFFPFPPPPEKKNLVQVQSNFSKIKHKKGSNCVFFHSAPAQELDELMKMMFLCLKLIFRSFLSTEREMRWRVESSWVRFKSIKCWNDLPLVTAGMHVHHQWRFRISCEIRAAKSFVVSSLYLERTQHAEKRMLSRECRVQSQNLLHFPPFPQSAAAQNPLKHASKQIHFFPPRFPHSLARSLSLCNNFLWKSEVID